MNLFRIEVNLENINSKKLDREFAVDPLFKKTCADFDQGGASGLLLNHLSIGLDGRIIFDTEDIQTTIQTSSDLQEEKQEYLTTHLFDYLPHYEIIEFLEICPSLKSFTFIEENKLFNAKSYLENILDFQERPNVQEDLVSENGIDGGMGGFDIGYDGNHITFYSLYHE